jgi:hypothetical protein
VGKGGYHGGSTIIRTRPKLSGRKNPKKGALDSWVAGANEAAINLPDDIRLKPIGDARPEGKVRKKKAQGTKKTRKKKRAKTAKADRKLDDSKVATRKPNEPLPEYAELVKALREKYSK